MSELDPKKSERIEKLQKDLYSQEYKNNINERSDFSRSKIDVDSQWQQDDSLEKFVIPEKQPMSLIKKIFLISFAFFLACAGVAAFVFYRGLDIVSANKVDITFVGPASVAAGNELDVDIAIDNKNNIPLQNATVYIDYPDGTKKVEDISADLLHDKFELGDIGVGSTAHQTLKMVLFGASNTERDVNVKLEYTIKNSSQSFDKEKSYAVQISSAPIVMTIDGPKQISSNQEVTLNVSLTSNSAVPLSGLVLQSTYPFGFQFLDATPKPDVSTNGWAIGTLNPSEKRTFSVHGRLAGEEGDERVFNFSVGTASGSTTALKTVYLTTPISVVVHKPAISVAMDLNNSVQDSQKNFISPGQSKVGQLLVTNNTAGKIINAQVDVVFSGNAVDYNSPTGSAGLYRLPTHTIVWDKTQVAQLAVMNPGQTLKLSFNFRALSAAELNAVKNGTITATSHVSATIPGDQTGQNLQSLATQSLQVQPTLNVVPRLVYYSGSFHNTGPIPPKAETPTTYTAIWTITSSSDDMAGVTVSAALPSYVKWLSATSPDITWNQSQNEVLWHVGDIPAGVVGSPVREVQFQIQVTPSTSQVGTQPPIVTNIVLNATDNFTQNPVTVQALDLSTDLSTDPSASGTSGIVVK